MLFKRTVVVLISLLSVGRVALSQGYKIISPNRKIEISLVLKDQIKKDWFFQVEYLDNNQYHVAIPSINFGLKGDNFTFADHIKLLKAEKEVKITENYVALHGKRKLCSNEATERIFQFGNSEGKKMNIIIRAYNDGIAFRYTLPGKSTDRVTVTDELTSYEIAPQSDRWLQHFVPSYEGFYTNQDKGIKQGQWGYPCLFKTDADGLPCWMLISEAGLDSNYCATKLGNEGQINHYKLLLPSSQDGNGTGEIHPSFQLPWASPWRVVILGQLSDLVQSTLIDDLSPASRITDNSWIKPGISSWVYWAYNHGTRDYKKVVEYIDLAARMNWPYTLFDWEWDTMENGGNLEDAVKYAASKGIKPIMWYNSGGPHNQISATPRDRMFTHENRMKEFAWLKKIGVYGVKIDFFESDKQNIIKYYLDILEDAARFHLMVNFHGATIPRGWSRTYPNLMSMEAVYGAEQYNNGPEMTTMAAAHNATLPFTRNIIGPMDYTPVTFTNSQHVHTTTFAHELALSVIFESGIQHFADRPSGFDNLPDAPKAFLRQVPASWDETRFVQGYPGKQVVLARRKGTNWYMAGINGENKGGKVKSILNFLSVNKTYRMTLISDGDHDTSFSTEYKMATSADVLEVKWLPMGGFTVFFEEM